MKDSFVLERGIEVAVSMRLDTFRFLVVLRQVNCGLKVLFPVIAYLFSALLPYFEKIKAGS
jgi:hypothetical protein